jgi:hypothetical protein
MCVTLLNPDTHLATTKSLPLLQTATHIFPGTIKCNCPTIKDWLMLSYIKILQLSDNQTGIYMLAHSLGKTYYWTEKDIL